MGEVYRARDAKLGREVAIKVLPPAFTSDPGRLARFDREARTLAALNHPNICAIHGFEHADEIRFLVLELVGGETLADRLAGTRGTAPAVRALPRARRPAHRATDRAGARLRPRARHRPSRSETGEHQNHAGWRGEGAGLRSRQSDCRRCRGRRSRTGAERHARRHDRRRPPRHAGLHESRAGARQAGRQTHRHLGVRLRAVRDVDRARRVSGDTLADTIAKVIEREPDWSALPRSTPEPIRQLLLACLVKDSQQRLQDIGDVTIDEHSVGFGERNDDGARGATAESARCSG